MSGQTESLLPLIDVVTRAYFTPGGMDYFTDWLAAREAAAEARGAERALLGIRFRIEVACEGYANLMDDDVPGGIADLAAYQEGAHDAAEAIRTALAAQAAPSRVPGEES